MKKRVFTYCLLISMWLVSPVSGGASSAGVNVPSAKTLDNASLKDFFSFPARLIVQLYRSVLGKGVRSVCPMYPSCSTYGMEALHSDGFLRGSLKTFDRLNRCGHDVYIYPVVKIGGQFRYSDSVVYMP